MDNREKPNLLYIAIGALIPTIISLAISVAIQWFTMESAIVNISPSTEVDGQYLTVISIQNLKEETLSNLSLYFDADSDVLEIKSNDEFEHQKQYVELERISPKANYSVMVWTAQPVLKGKIIAESDYKIRLDYSNNNSPFLLQILWFIIPFGCITFFATGIQIWINWKQQIKESKKIDKRCNELQKELEQVNADRQSLQEEINTAQETLENATKEDKKQREILKKETQELRSYFLVRNSQLRKELSFWRDTVRKLLYNSKDEFQSADRVVETVTSTLKTYTTREHSTDNMDALLYLAQLMADSRELHNRDNSPNQNNDV